MAKPTYKETLTVRKDLDFGLDSDAIPRYWFANNPLKTRLMDAVQATFPDGERYFISTVRAFRGNIESQELREAVRDFMLQEGQHGIVHTRYNQRLARQGVAIDRVTKTIKSISDARLRRYSAEYNVALTAAFEHFTAMMAELFFAEQHILAGADERVRAMFAWHAVEEMEHKSVAFDVMQKTAHVGYFRRTLAMTHASLSFTFFSTVFTWMMLGMDGLNRRQRLSLFLKNGAWLLSPRKGVLSRLTWMILPYYKPGFHPEQIKTVHNYSAWVESYAKSHDPIEASEQMYAAAR